jgi:hypothetical protein
MKTFMAVALVLLLSAGPACAADAPVSQDSLARMGLGGMQEMSDVEGTQIRETPEFIWPPEQMTYTISGLHYRLVIQWFPLPLLFW